MLLTLGRGTSPLLQYQNSDSSMKGVVSSAVFDLDVTQAASYAGSGQTWANMVPAPADGSAQTAYDFYFGLDGNVGSGDPTFNGSAGSAAAYFSMDGGDFFSLASGANTAFLNALHKTTDGSAFWIAVAYRPVDGGAVVLCDTKTASSGNGIGLLQNSAERIQAQQGNGSAAVVSSSSSHGALMPGSDYVYIISVAANGGTMRSWLNSASKVEESITYGTTTTNSSPLYLFSRSGGGTPITNGTRVYAFAMGNAFIDDAQAAAILGAYEARHGRDYTS